MHYDASGNLLSEKLDIPLLHHVKGPLFPTTPILSATHLTKSTHRNNDTHTYDPNGNLVAIRKHVPIRFAYDAENRLIAKSSPEGEVSYAYNAFGHLVSVTREGKTTRRFHDHLNRVLLERASSHDMKMHVYLEERLAATIQSDGTVLFYHEDHRGNVCAITNEAGEAVCAYTYLPYGGIRKKYEALKPQPYTFLGMYGVWTKKTVCT
jgi:YD repeat-containing protein